MVMEANESWERYEQGLKRAASCCRELAKILDAQEWRDLSYQLIKMLNKGRVIYKDVPLTEMQILGLLTEMEMAQRNARQMRIN